VNPSPERHGLPLQKCLPVAARLYCGTTTDLGRRNKSTQLGDGGSVYSVKADGSSDRNQSLAKDASKLRNLNKTLDPEFVNGYKLK
jgi:hypothetical protein